jgi:hypothetical protein
MDVSHGNLNIRPPGFTLELEAGSWKLEAGS